MESWEVPCLKVNQVKFWRKSRKGAAQTEESKNARGIWVVGTQTLGAHCNVHEIAGWIGMLGGAQRRRRRAKNRQDTAVVIDCSSMGYLPGHVVAF
jgi:hypothetical protein